MLSKLLLLLLTINTSTMEKQSAQDFTKIQQCLEPQVVMINYSRLSCFMFGLVAYSRDISSGYKQ